MWQPLQSHRLKTIKEKRGIFKLQLHHWYGGVLLFRQVYRPGLHNWWNDISRQIILAYLCYQRDH